jgi:hypothetical protein
MLIKDLYSLKNKNWGLCFNLSKIAVIMIILTTVCLLSSVFVFADVSTGVTYTPHYLGKLADDKHNVYVQYMGLSTTWITDAAYTTLPVDPIVTSSSLAVGDTFQVVANGPQDVICLNGDTRTTTVTYEKSPAYKGNSEVGVVSGTYDIAINAFIFTLRVTKSDPSNPGYVGRLTYVCIFKEKKQEMKVGYVDVGISINGGLPSVPTPSAPDTVAKSSGDYTVFKGKPFEIVAVKPSTSSEIASVSGIGWDSNEPNVAKIDSYDSKGVKIDPVGVGQTVVSTEGTNPAGEFILVQSNVDVIDLAPFEDIFCEFENVFKDYLKNVKLDLPPGVVIDPSKIRFEIFPADASTNLSQYFTWSTKGDASTGDINIEFKFKKEIVMLESILRAYYKNFDGTESVSRDIPFTINALLKNVQ